MDSTSFLLVLPPSHTPLPGPPGQWMPQGKAPGCHFLTWRRRGQGATLGGDLGNGVSLLVSGRASMSTSSLAGTSFSFSQGPETRSVHPPPAGCRVGQRGALWVR